MPIAICGLSEVPSFATVPLDHIFSIREHNQPGPDIRGFKTDFTLHSFVFADTGDAVNPLAVSERQMRRLLEVYAQTKLEQKILFHCFAGVSRSSAAALIWLVHHGISWGTAYEWVVKVRGPFVCPNPRMVQLADQIMGHDGKLAAFVQAETGRRAPERQAYFDGCKQVTA